VPLPYDTGKPSLSAAAIADPPVYDRARAARVIPRPCATWSRASNIGIATRACRCLGGGRRLPAPSCSPTPTWSCRFPSTGRGSGRGASSSRPCWHKRLSAAQRRKNVAGTFRVTALREQIQGKRTIVVDDVITTGATAEACAPGAEAGRRSASRCSRAGPSRGAFALVAL